MATSAVALYEINSRRSGSAQGHDDIRFDPSSSSPVRSISSLKFCVVSIVFSQDPNSPL